MIKEFWKFHHKDDDEDNHQHYYDHLSPKQREAANKAFQKEKREFLSKGKK